MKFLKKTQPFLIAILFLGLLLLGGRSFEAQKAYEWKIEALEGALVSQRKNHQKETALSEEATQIEILGYKQKILELNDQIEKETWHIEQLNAELQ